MTTSRGSAPTIRITTPASLSGAIFAEYIDWRVEHPSDDIMTQLLNAEFEDENGATATADPRRAPRLRQHHRRGGERDHAGPDRLHAASS